jgi:FtsZ-binding cell division protein ZapB
LICVFTKHGISWDGVSELTELVLPQAQVLGELVLEPINKALQEENGRLKTENGVLKERELSKNKEILLKQELVDEYKARSKSVEDEIQRSKDDNQRFRDEVSSLKEKEIRLTVEVEYLKRIDEQLRLENEYLKRRDEERAAERVMSQTMMSTLIRGLENRKRKRNEDGDTK